MDKLVNYLDEDGTARIVENIELKVQGVLSEVDDKIDVATSDFVTIEEAESVAIKETVQGESILIEDSAKWKLKGLKLFGKSTQDGTPSPENPVPIVSAGDIGSITVSVTGDGAEPKSLIYLTPNGLPGIPVSSGGNYTDESGQQWVCDEVDFGRGVYVKRVATESVWDFYVYRETPDAPGRFQTNSVFAFGIYKNGAFESISNFWKWTVWGNVGLQINTEWIFAISGSYFYVRPPAGSGYSVDSLNEYLHSVVSEQNPIVFIAQLSEIEEIPLEDSILSAYAALHTNYPTTTVMNNADAGMEVGYVADTKNYINKLLLG